MAASYDPHVSSAKAALTCPFIPHAHLRTRESDSLVKKKTLGMSRIRTYRPSSFVPVGMAGAAAEAEKHMPCEPLVLWRPDKNTESEAAWSIELEKLS